MCDNKNQTSHDKIKTIITQIICDSNYNTEA